jgi:Xaa-Pro aminopeptidase
MNLKIRKIYPRLESIRLDGFIFSSPANISYLTDYCSRDSYLFISRKGNFYITDSRYCEEAKKNLLGFKVEEARGSVFRKIADICSGLGLKCIGFEERYLSFAEYKQIRKELADSVGLVAAGGLVEELRQIKSAQEIAKIKKATEIAIAAFTFIKYFIRPGKKEIEIAGELERFIRYNGASASSFPIIVASGPNSSFPHHLSSERRIGPGEPVLVDLGVDYQGYKSDLTRVILSGKISSLAQRISKIVRTAQEAAIKKIKPGLLASEVDAFSRNYIEKKGYGACFGHSLGHGIGLEVHEEPRISKKETKKLEAGMVFTVEPAIYLPGKFGIRLEDMVLVTKKGSEVLSGALDK